MEIYLFTIEESENDLSKQIHLEDGIQVVGTMRTTLDLEKPIITIDPIQNPTYLTIDKLIMYNYCLVTGISRFCFINNIKCLEGNVFDLELIVDPLYTFKQLILSQHAHILKNEFVFDSNIDEHLKIKADFDITTYKDSSSPTIVQIQNNHNFNFAPSETYHCVINALTVPSSALGSPSVVPHYRNLPEINYEMASDMFLGSTVQCIKFADLAVVTDAITNDLSSLMTFVKNISLLPFEPTTLADLGNKVFIGLRTISLPTDSHCYTLEEGSRERFLFRTFVIHKYYNDFRDYEPYTRYNIYLPFIGWVNLKANDVLGDTCRVYYSYDYESGKGLCYIYNLTKDIVIFTSECNMAVNVSLSKTNIEQNNIASEQHAIQFSMKTLTSLFASGAFSFMTGNPAPLAAGLAGGFFGGLGELAHQADAYIDEANVRNGSGNLITQLPLDLFIKITRTKTTVDPKLGSYKHIYGRSCNNEFGILEDYTGFTQAFVDDFVCDSSVVEDIGRTPTKRELEIILQKLKDGVFLP